jgi:hypothetical protein
MYLTSYSIKYKRITTIPWIEKLLQTPINYHMKYVIRIVFSISNHNKKETGIQSSGGKVSMLTTIREK